MGDDQAVTPWARIGRVVEGCGESHLLGDEVVFRLAAGFPHPEACISLANVGARAFLEPSGIPPACVKPSDGFSLPSQPIVAQQPLAHQPKVSRAEYLMGVLGRVRGERGAFCRPIPNAYSMHITNTHSMHICGRWF